MMRISYFIILTLLIYGCGQNKSNKATNDLEEPVQLEIVQDESSGQIQVYRQGLPEQAILVQEAREDFRPYIHPILAPDGEGMLTEYSPEHHRHQTGLYWGFTRVNDRDYFHHPDDSHWRKVAANVLEAKGDEVAWQTVYEMLDSLGQPIMTETQMVFWGYQEGQYYLERRSEIGICEAGKRTSHHHRKVDISGGCYLHVIFFFAAGKRAWSRK